MITALDIKFLDLTRLGKHLQKQNQPREWLHYQINLETVVNVIHYGLIDFYTQAAISRLIDDDFYDCWPNQKEKKETFKWKYPGFRW